MVFNVLYQTLSEVLKIFNKYDCFYDLVIDTLEWVLVYPHCKFEQMRVRILMAFYEMFIIRIRVIRSPDSGHGRIFGYCYTTAIF